MEKIEKGQTVWLKYIGGIHNRNGKVTEHKVDKVGRKWFTVEDRSHWRDRFSVETLMHDGGEYQTQYRVYTSIEALEDEQLFVDNKKEIDRLIKGITLEQSIQILNILNHAK